METMAKGQKRSNKEPRKVKTADKQLLPKYLRPPELIQQPKLGASRTDRGK
jgi:hypothetical protein